MQICHGEYNFTRERCHFRSGKQQRRTKAQDTVNRPSCNQFAKTCKCKLNIFDKDEQGSLYIPRNRKVPSEISTRSLSKSVAIIIKIAEMLERKVLLSFAASCILISGATNQTYTGREARSPYFFSFWLREKILKKEKKSCKTSVFGRWGTTNFFMFSLHYIFKNK